MKESGQPKNTIEFIVRYSPIYRNNQPLEIIPVVDSVELTDLIEKYEADQQFGVVGGHGGIIPLHFNYGSLHDYYLGARDHEYWGKFGKIAVLGCGDCGEVGCWPFYADVEVAHETVTWSGFEQGHRKVRDYSGLGPFRFDRRTYEQAVTGAVQAFNSQPPVRVIPEAGLLERWRARLRELFRGKSS